MWPNWKCWATVLQLEAVGTFILLIYLIQGWLRLISIPCCFSFLLLSHLIGSLSLPRYETQETVTNMHQVFDS